MNPDPARTAALRERLSCDGRSYRAIVSDDYGGEFSHTVLQRIVKDGKFPKEPRILHLLGLVEKRTRTNVQKAIAKMARDMKNEMEQTWQKNTTR